MNSNITTNNIESIRIYDCIGPKLSQNKTFLALKICCPEENWMIVEFYVCVCSSSWNILRFHFKSCCMGQILLVSDKLNLYAGSISISVLFHHSTPSINPTSFPPASCNHICCFFYLRCWKRINNKNSKISIFCSSANFLFFCGGNL